LSNGAYSLTAAVTGEGSAVPTGQVSFIDNSNDVLVGTATLGSGTTTRGFPATVYSGAGSEPVPLASGDFNGDGVPDLAAASVNLGGNGVDTVTIFFMSSTPGFYGGQESFDLPGLTGGITGLVAGDFNNDGSLDLAAVGQPNQLDILFGNGRGGFVTSVQTIPAMYPRSLAVGDFDRDGNSDLAITDQFAATVTVLLGNGKGGFAQASGPAPATGSWPSAVAVGDFNGDGKPDLAVSCYFANSVTILLGSGDGAFAAGTSLETGIYPMGIAVADLNADGKQDLAVVNQFSQDVNIFLGNGNGGFAAPAASGYQAPGTGKTPDSITVADLNGDGIPDLAVASSGSSEVTLLFGKGDGTFPSDQNIPTGGSIGQIASRDLNGDGIPDLVVTDPGSNTMTELLNLTTSTATAQLTGIQIPGYGSQTVIPQYGGNTSYSGSSAKILGLIGTPVTSSVTLSAQPTGTIVVAQSIQLTAKVLSADKNANPDGNSVTFFDGNNQIGQAAVSGGQAVVGVKFSTTGTHTLSAIFAGDQRIFAPSKSSTLTLNVGQ
jgi:hypothetical protein